MLTHIGIGLAFAFATAEAGANVAVLDVSDVPHPHFDELPKRFPKQQFRTYKQGYLSPVRMNELANSSSRTNVTQYGVLQNSIDQVVRDFGRIDGL